MSCSKASEGGSLSAASAGWQHACSAAHRGNVLNPTLADGAYSHTAASCDKIGNHHKRSFAVAEHRSRRAFLKGGLRSTATLGLGAVAGGAITTSEAGSTVWQIDPAICQQCERCATHCVLAQSAVRCVHAFDICGYCALCGGYHHPDAKIQDTAAEHQLCPTGALIRTFIEEPYFEYTVDEALCIGCARCVKGCAAFGNGSLYLQVRHDLCVNCNECSIARVCPSDAFRQVPRDQPYLLKGGSGV